VHQAAKEWNFYNLSVAVLRIRLYHFSTETGMGAVLIPSQYSSILQ
jgi:hypothetical protein